MGWWGLAWYREEIMIRLRFRCSKVKRYSIHAICSALAMLAVMPTAVSAETKTIYTNDIAWHSLGRDENDSMPIGNGDLAANVWTEQNGDLVLLVAKSDAWSELGKLLKIGRVRIKLTPNPFAGTGSFTQTLRLEDGSVEIRSGGNRMQVWVDANHPVVYVAAHFARPVGVEAALELWRNKDHSYDAPSPDEGGLFEFGNHSVPINLSADTILPATSDRLTWYHFNSASIYPLLLEKEHLESLAAKYSDPLLHRCFGATLTGDGMKSVDQHRLQAVSPRRDLQLRLVALTRTGTTPEEWASDLSRLADQQNKESDRAALTHHRLWWRQFWQRSWLYVGGTEEADKVSQGYVIQRYMMASSSRNGFPTNFNGGLFTVGHDMPDNQESTPKSHSPDFRAWGNSYWNQNDRLLYWPLIATGDYDLLQPWFDMYLRALPLAEDATKIHFHHAGAVFVETQYFWGLPNLNDFGWDNPTNIVESRWMRYHIQGSLEVIDQMLDEYDNRQDTDFARNKLVPFADAIVTSYDQQWPHTTDGRLRLSPSQSLETYQLNAVNPTPDIAGLKTVLGRLVALPDGITTDKKRVRWKRMLDELPPLPTGRTFAGKIPPAGAGDTNGTAIILPAQEYGKTSNRENPESYIAFPYRLFGVGKPNLKLARDTFAARLFPWDVCWGQDGPQAAVLGLTKVAQRAAEHEFTDYGDQRFVWFWKAGGDWIPDLDNGGTGMITLQMMLMQTDGRRIQLLPAWPHEWTADFKLHAPYKTVVEGHVENGKVSRLHVTPASRAADVVIVPAAAN